MSALAKVFVVLNLLLSLLFFGTSATLFLTRQDLRKKNVQLQAELDREKEGADKQVNLLKATLNDQDRGIVKLRASETRLSGSLKTAKEKVSAETSRADAERAARQAADEKVTSTTNLLNTRESHIQDLEKQVQDANEKRDQALATARAATDEKNRAVRDLELVNQQLHETKVEVASLSRKSEKMELTIQYAEKLLGGKIPLGEGEIARPIDCLVEAVDPALKAVVLSVGRDQEVKIGNVFHVYRDDSYVGKVKVTKLYRDLAGAKVVLEADGASIRPGDKATTRFSLVN